MNDTPRGVRPHIVLLGKCNVGKSTLINALCGQDIALVSSQAGTTTDPVYKSMELLPFGPVVFVDTAGFDDLSPLGRERVKLTERVLRKADLVLLVVDSPELLEIEQETLATLTRQNCPTLLVVNTFEETLPAVPEGLCAVNARTGLGIRPLREQMAQLLKNAYDERPLVQDLLINDAPVILVTPIDNAAPKGRLILPQVQMIRDILDAGCTTLVCREFELETALQQLTQKPQMVITDSQVFKLVAAIVPDDIPLTSFSILMARYKGDLPQLLEGVKALDELQPGDKVLVAEACTHHSQEDDIGRVKIPHLLQARIGGKLHFTWSAGQDFPQDITSYKVVIHCGACMLNRKEMLTRLRDAEVAGVAIVNYGLLLAHLNGILERSVQVLKREIGMIQTR